jgi:type VI secretion system protein ImpB
MSSIHEKLERVRKPRVHIKYEVETEGALIEKELPFVVGVLGDFSGNPTEPLKPFRERKFIQIDRDNFDEVMARMTPGLNLWVDNTLAKDGTQIHANLKFEKLTDFEPAAVVAQVPALAKLLETRNQLRDLLTKADRSEDLESLLEHVLQDKGELKRLAEDLEPNDPKPKDLGPKAGNGDSTGA